MSTQIRLDKDIKKKIEIKMLNDFDKISINPLVRVILNKYIDSEFSLEKEKIKERFKYEPEEIKRINLYLSDELLNNFDKIFENKTGLNASNKRTATLETCFIKWLEGELIITKKEFEEFYVR